MLKKKIIFFIALIFLVASCNSWDSVKRGLTGAKERSNDEFLVQKKDPLILPPDFDSLPTPTERTEALEELTTFEEKLKKESSVESISSGSDSTEKSILKQIQKK